MARHRGAAQGVLLFLRFQQTGHGLLEVLGDAVDDVVVLDVHALGLGQSGRPLVGDHVEADDDGVGGLGQQDVALGDPAGAAWRITTLTSSVLSSVRCFLRTSTEPCTSALTIRFSSLTWPASMWREQVVQGHLGPLGQGALAREGLGLFGRGLGAVDVVQAIEPIARLRHVVQAQDLHGHAPVADLMVRP